MHAVKPRVLIVDDELSLAETLADGLADRGYEAEAVSDSTRALTLVAEDRFDALVTDLRMGKTDGLALLSASKAASPDRPVIVMTAFSAVDSAIESIRRGAYHYLTKPFKVEELDLFLSRALEEVSLRREASALRKSLRDQYSFEGIVGTSAAMQKLTQVALRVKDADTPLLIVGETGTGKGLLARAIHAHGSHAKGPFVTVSCAALPEQLLESELFGHVKGAFTGASQNRAGLFEEARGGVLFLDEIGEMSLPLQAKLLDVIERRKVRAVGENKERDVDARVFAATHRDLRARVAEGAFREDLLYRIDVVTLEVPAVRHRRGDVPALLDHFLALAKSKNPSSPVKRFSREATAKAYAYDWPGNVRELSHAVERCVLLGASEEIQESDLPSQVTMPRDKAAAFSGPVLPLRELQRRYAAWALDELGGKRMVAAEKLDVDAKTLAKLLAEAGK